MTSTRERRRRPTEKQWWAGVVLLVVGSWVVPLLWGSTWMLEHGRVVGLVLAAVAGLGYELVLRPKNTYVAPPRDPDAPVPPPGRHRKEP